MMVILLAAATVADVLPPPMPLPHPTEARSVVESQLAAPPRTGADAGLGPDEADAILKRYIASIGQRLDPAPGESPR